MAEESLSDVIKTYQSWRKSRGIAHSTWKRDQITLMGLAKEAGRIKASSLSTSHIDSFFLTRSSLSASTQNLDLATLRSFFTFLQSRGYHRKATTLLADYKPLKYVPELRRRVAVGQFPTLLDSAESPRDRIVVALGLYLFLRSSEIKLLKIRHVNLDTDEIAVKVPKTRDADVMPISRELARELRTWLTYYTTKAGPLDPEWFLIPSIVLKEWHRGERGRMIAPAEPDLIPTRPVYAPEKIVQRTLKGIGWDVTYREGVHTLRRSGARALYDELAERDGHTNALEAVSAMLHHKVMATTQHYLGLTESRLKRDRVIRGELMFPSLAGPNVTDISTRHDLGHG